MKYISCLKISFIFLVVLLLSSCAGMIADSKLKHIKYYSFKNNPHSVAVNIDKYVDIKIGLVSITKEELKGEIEDAIRESKLFSSVKDGPNGGDYLINVSMDYYYGGMGNRSEIGIHWSLVKTSNKKVILSRKIETEHESDAMGNVFVFTESMKGAVRKNISAAISDFGSYDIESMEWLPGSPYMKKTGIKN